MNESGVITGDARVVLPSLPEESVHSVVTSPPYFNLRDYRVDGQRGLERTPEEYVANLVDLFRRVRRVLRRDGTVWLVLGDAYASKARGSATGEGDHRAEGFLLISRFGVAEDGKQVEVYPAQSHEPSARTYGTEHPRI